MTLKSSLENLKDFDIAYHDLACLLGMAKAEDFIKFKSIYNSNNKVNTALYKIFQALQEIDAVVDDGTDMFRWNDKFQLDSFSETA